jgi:hypothetical protein
VGGSGATGATGGSGATGGTGATGGSSTGGTGGTSSVTLPPGCINDPSFVADCNPVTNEPCDTAAAAACDFSDVGVTCYGEGNTAQPGAPCDTGAGEFCVPMYHCDGATQSNPVGVCKKFCCANTDCGSGESCTAFDAALGTFGLCNGGGTGGAGGAGGSAGAAGSAGSAGSPPADAAAD